MLEIAGGIILAIILLPFVTLLIGLVIVAAPYILVLGIIAGLFFYFPSLFGWFIFIFLIAGMLATLYEWCRKLITKGSL